MNVPQTISGALSNDMMFTLDALLRQALQEDIGNGDLTTTAIIPEDARGEAIIVANEDGVVAGGPIATRLFQLFDPELSCQLIHYDGTRVKRGDPIMTIHGHIRSILTVERVALNLLMRLSGIATATYELVASIAGTRARIADTRKTMPLFRILDKYAVRMGGGVNHRFGLYDAILIKDNHLAYAGSIQKAVHLARQRASHLMPIEVEIERLEDIPEVIASGADAVLFDNMSPTDLKRAVQMVGGRLTTEASGGITKENIRAIAESGVDIISVGRLTHSVQALDISLDLQG